MTANERALGRVAGAPVSVSAVSTASFDPQMPIAANSLKEFRNSVDAWNHSFLNSPKQSVLQETRR